MKESVLRMEQRLKSPIWLKFEWFNGAICTIDGIDH